MELFLLILIGLMLLISEDIVLLSIFKVALGQYWTPVILSLPSCQENHQ